MIFEAYLVQFLTAAAIQQHEFYRDRCEEPPHARPTMIQAQPGHPSVGPNLFTSATVMYMRCSCGGSTDMSLDGNCTVVAFSPDTKSCGTRSSVSVPHPMEPVSQPAADHRNLSGILLAPLLLKMPSPVMTNNAFSRHDQQSSCATLMTHIAPFLPCSFVRTTCLALCVRHCHVYVNHETPVSSNSLQSSLSQLCAHQALYDAC